MAPVPKHQRVVQLLKERLLADLRDDIHSIVLFGSVARGEDTEDSDIDILVITDAPFEIKQRIRDITYDLALDHRVLIQLVFFTTHAFEDEVVKYRSYFASDIVTQGIILKDDGTFRGICQKIHPASAGVSER